jgi:hypothetical protein
MYIDFYPTIKDVEEVLDNLSELTKEEIIKSYGKDYKSKMKNIFCFANWVYLIRLKTDNKPVGIFGLIEETSEIAGIFFLSTDGIYQGNMIKLIRESKKVVDEWLKEYKVLLDDCYLENEKVKRWLHLLGFKPTGEIKEGGFATYYKGDKLCLT